MHAVDESQNRSWRLKERLQRDCPQVAFFFPNRRNETKIVYWKSIKIGQILDNIDLYKINDEPASYARTVRKMNLTEITTFRQGLFEEIGFRGINPPVKYILLNILSRGVVLPPLPRCHLLLVGDIVTNPGPFLGHSGHVKSLA